VQRNKPEETATAANDTSKQQSSHNAAEMSAKAQTQIGVSQHHPLAWKDMPE
jgi:hypothetical protein